MSVEGVIARDEREQLDLEQVSGLRPLDIDGPGERVLATQLEPAEDVSGGLGSDRQVEGVTDLELDRLPGLNPQCRRDLRVPAIVGVLAILLQGGGRRDRQAVIGTDAVLSCGQSSLSGKLV